MEKATLLIFIGIGLSLPISAQYSAGRTDPFKNSARQAPPRSIDQPLLKQYKEKGIRPAGTCSGSIFVRRIYLDLTGSIPTADEARSFIENRSMNKRASLIDELLASDGFSDYSAMLWCDRLRVKSEFPINLWPNAVQAYHRWIHTSIRENKHYDQFVSEILISNGSNFRVPQVNFFRAVQNNEPESLARAAALSFMGTRYDAWPEEQQSNLAAFFSDVRFKKTGEWKEEIVYADLFSMSTNRRPEQLTFPDGISVNIPLHMDARAAFSDWLTSPKNPWFSKNAVNRIWHQLFGIGIIDAPDDLRPDNPPANAALLALLEKELIKSDYDLRHIYRLILNSATYQRSSIPQTNTPEAERLFAHYSLRRVDAETLIDSLCRITGTREQYWSVIPEPFSFMPMEDGSVTLADGSITSPFLEKFGRPPRDTGLASERNNEITGAQMLHLLNSSHIREKLDRVAVNIPRRNRGNPQENIAELYLSILSRPPTTDELKVLQDYSESAEAQGASLAADVAWALINSPEFIFKH
jgi:hypothetical protein